MDCTAIIGAAKGSRIFLMYQSLGCYIEFDDLKLCSNINVGFSSLKLLILALHALSKLCMWVRLFFTVTTTGTGNDMLQDIDGAEGHYPLSAQEKRRPWDREWTSSAPVPSRRRGDRGKQEVGPITLSGPCLVVMSGNWLYHSSPFTEVSPLPRIGDSFCIYTFRFHALCVQLLFAIICENTGIGYVFRCFFLRNIGRLYLSTHVRVFILVFHPSQAWFLPSYTATPSFHHR